MSHTFHHNDLDEIRRAYLQRGSCQPLSHDFPIKNKKFSEALHWFNLGWFKENKNWLDQIIKKRWCIFFIVTYLDKLLVIEWKINK